MDDREESLVRNSRGADIVRTVGSSSICPGVETDFKLEKIGSCSMRVF